MPDSGASAAGYGGGMAELNILLAAMADALHQDVKGGVDPNRLVQLAAGAMAHATDCALTVLRARGRPQTVAASGPLPRAVNDLQFDLREGPCLDAVAGADDLVLVNDLAADRRWSRFSPLCVERTGVRAMLSVRLGLDADDRAVLGFYATEPAVFTDVDVSVASLLAPLATSAVQAELYRQEVAQLEMALTTSRQIGAAVGILMSQRGLTYEKALSELRTASQHLNVKLRDLAFEVQHTGTIPVDGAFRSSVKDHDDFPAT